MHFFLIDQSFDFKIQESQPKNSITIKPSYLCRSTSNHPLITGFTLSSKLFKFPELNYIMQCILQYELLHLVDDC